MSPPVLSPDGGLLVLNTGFDYNTNQMKKSVELQNVVWKEGEYYVAQCLNVDVSSFGKTQNEALKNLIEAVELYMEDKDSNDFGLVANPRLIKRSLAYA